MLLLGKGFALALFSSALLAQGVFVTQGKNGPLFSNVPQQGAREVQLKPLNVIEPPTMPASEPATVATPTAVKAEPKTIAGAGAGAGAADNDVAAYYRSFFFVYPENNGAVAASTAAFDVHLAVDPPLQLERQHAFVVAINGRRVDQRFTASEFMVPPEFWNERLPPDNQLIQLDASIVDGDDRVLKRAEPVQFYLRRLAFAPRPRPRAGRPPNMPPPPIEAPAPGAGLERVPPAGQKAMSR